MIDLPKLATKVGEENKEIVNIISSLSEAKKIEYYRRYALAHQAYIALAYTESSNNRIDEWADSPFSLRLLKYSFVASCTLVAIDIFFFGFNGWSIGSSFVLLLVSFGFLIHFRAIDNFKSFERAFWDNEVYRTRGIVEGSGLDSFVFNDLLKFKRGELLEDEPIPTSEGENERMNWVNTHTEEDLWNQVKLRLLHQLEKL